MAERNGKKVPQKVGMAPMMRDGFDFEVTTSFDLDQNHKAFCTKDRTCLFSNQEPFVISIDTGKKILEWCCSDTESSLIEDVCRRIDSCKSVKELIELYHQFPAVQKTLKPQFEQQKRRLLINQEVVTELINQKQSKNGIH
jgi:hypothetical protein